MANGNKYRHVTPKQIVAIAARLDQVFDKANGRYKPGFSDIAIGAEMGVSHHSVSNVRVSFGMVLKSAVTRRNNAADNKRIEALHDTVDRMRKHLDLLEERCDALQERVKSFEGGSAVVATNTTVEINRLKFLLERIGNQTPGVRYGMLVLEAESKFRWSPRNGEGKP